MPRLSRGDVSQLVKALRHFLDPDAECPDRGELAQVLRRLSQRVEEPPRRGRTWLPERQVGPRRQPVTPLEIARSALGEATDVGTRVRKE